MNIKWKQHLLPELHELKDKRVIIRMDWNMPITGGIITDTSRFDITVPFLKDLSLAGAKMILITHFGEKGEHLDVIANHVTKSLPFISFVPTFDFNEITHAVDNLKDGDGILL